MDFSKINEGFEEDDKDKLHFFYNREERLKSAPKIVQDYYAGKALRPVKGIFRVLVANKANRVMLISIVIFAAAVWSFSILKENKTGIVSGIKAELKAFSYEEGIFVSLKLAENKKKEKEILPVKVIFYAFEQSGELLFKTEESSNYLGQEMFIRTKFSDYDIIKVCAEVFIEDNSRLFTSFVEKH